MIIDLFIFSFQFSNLILSQNDNHNEQKQKTDHQGSIWSVWWSINNLILQLSIQNKSNDFTSTINNIDMLQGYFIARFIFCVSIYKFRHLASVIDLVYMNSFYLYKYTFLACIVQIWYTYNIKNKEYISMIALNCKRDTYRW